MEKYTDQEFFYKQTPVNYDGIAKFTSIKGNTLVWNQLVQNGNFESTSNWSRTRVSTSASSNVLTVTVTEASTGKGQRVYQNLGFNDTHKRLYRVEMKGTSGKNLCFGNHTSDAAGYTTISSVTADGSWQTLSGFSNENKPYLLIGMNGNTSVGDSYQIRNVVCFDLTQMFGSGNEPSTVEEFTSLFPLSYYDYNAGNLLSFNGTGLKTIGKNLIDFKGKLSSSGLITSNSFYLPIGEYYLYIFLSANSGGFNSYTHYSTDGSTFSDIQTSGSVCYCDAQMSYSRKKCKLTVLSPCWIKQTIQQNANTNGQDYYTMLTSDGSDYSSMSNVPSYSMLNEVYEPYTSSTLSLPISTYFPTGMKSVGSVYDELTESKAITRVGSVDLGALTYTIDAGNTLYAPITGLKGVGQSEMPNILCALFTPIKYSDRGSVSYPNISITSDLNIRFGNTGYTDATAFKQAMNGIYLYYELATETETDIDTEIFYPFYGDGTEQILPVNGSTPTTSYIIADIEYYDSTEGDSLYRRFWLINGDGERWDLTDKEFKSFLNNPTGLGFRKTIEITRYGEKANKNNEVYDFPQPSGELLFYDTYNSTRYDKYNKFIRFLMSQPITLYYMIPVSYISGIANIFTLNCDVTEVQKTESKTDHILTSSIVFNGLGFYEGDEISVNGTTDTYTLTNEGDFPVGFEITVKGSLVNPTIKLFQNHELYGEAKFDDATAFRSIYVNSKDGEQNIELMQGTSILPNPLAYQDLSISNGAIYVTFVKLARGSTNISIGKTSGSISSVEIKFTPQYRSV